METTTDFRKIQEELLKPIDFKYRIQSTKFGKATVVSYIDARQLQDRLDEVVGADKWQVKYEERKGNLFAGIGIKHNNEWIWKFDCGTESNVEKEKGEASDSFKRAGVMWGVGRFLYSLPIITLNIKDHTNKAGKTTAYPADDKGNILWNADDLNKYCHSLSAKGSKSKKADSTKVQSSEVIEINNCSTLEQLTAIYNNNPHLHTDTEFMDALSKKKVEISPKKAA